MNARTLRPDDPDVSASEILGQTQRILASRHFRSAKSLERFLRHVVEKKLNGQENSLKEYSIGLEVFQRGVNYDPKSDAVVRVQATLLRKKLAAYYAEEGLNDPIILDLPKGHYVANFCVRSTDAESSGKASAPAASIRRRGRQIGGFRLRGSQQLSLSACLRRLLINTGKEPPLGPVIRAHRFSQPRRRAPSRGRLHFRCGRNFLRRAPPTFWPTEHHSSSQVTGCTFVTCG